MALQAVSAMMILLNIVGQNCFHVTPEGKQDEDFHSFELFTETDEGISDNEQYNDGEQQASLADGGNKEGDYKLRSLPEYHVDTKADFEGNQEAIDWLMKDPNEYNVKSYVDSDDIGNSNSLNHFTDVSYEHNDDDDDDDAEAESEDHQTYESKINHATSAKDTSVSRVNHDMYEDEVNIVDDRQSRNKGEWNDQLHNVDNEGYEFSVDENRRKDERSWQNKEEDPQDDIYDDKHSQYDFEKGSRETTLKNLNNRIRNQDAKLVDEVENFQDIDNSGHFDDSDILGNLDEQRDQPEHSGTTKDDEDNSYSREDNLLSRKRKAKNKDAESENESDSHYANDIISISHPLKGEYPDIRGNKKINDSKFDQTSKDNYENSNDRADKTFTEKAKAESKIGIHDSVDSVRNTEESDKIGKRKENKANGKGNNESTTPYVTEQKFPKVTHKELHSDNKGEEVKSSYKHNPANGHILFTTRSRKRYREENKSKEIKENEVISMNENVGIGNGNHHQDDKLVDLKGRHDKQIPTDSNALKNVTIITTSSKEDNGQPPGNEESSRTSSASLEKHLAFKNQNQQRQKQLISTDVVIGHGKKVTAWTVNPQTGNHFTDNDKNKTKNSASGAYRGSLSEKKFSGVVTTLEKPLLTSQINNSKERNMVYNKLKDIDSNLKGITQKQKLRSPLREPPIITELSASPNACAQSYHTGECQTAASALLGLIRIVWPLIVKAGFCKPVKRQIHITGVVPENGTGKTICTRQCVWGGASRDWIYELKEESLEEHNNLRRKHFAQPLSWSNALAKKAQKIANSLATKAFLTLDDLQEQQGESVAQVQYTNQHLAKRAIDKWYSEINSYSFSYPKINSKTKHFVQIVWKEAKEMGLAVAKRPSGDYAFVVALYSPAINSKKHLQQNVLRPGVRNDLYSTFKRRR
ncbi:PREDICTED: uncharacterized protein DDB_G0283697-like [Acropora digitifera]|uniref:uncharacterized protein DDB_G0283697-like n=1 Tax=Acropora digitifera TaxID=70779 RepID=UPI00077AA653|nr:PREDICTED: uncharacterized protein DDB_G0283697-like [Acropora digitifera]